MRQEEDFPKLALDSFNIKNSPFTNLQEDHKKLVREMGATSNVLKNVKYTLPIDPKKTKKISIISSDSVVNSNLFNCLYHACNGHNLAYFPYLTGPLNGLADALGKNVEIQHSLNDWDLETAAETAAETDYAFVFANANSGEEIDEKTFVPGASNGHLN